MASLRDDQPVLVRIPADIDRPDRVIGMLTARQVAIFAAAGLLLWGVFEASRAFLPPVAFLALAVPVIAVAAVAGLGTRDGMSLDRLVVAAVRHIRAPKRYAPAPEAPVPWPDWLDPATIRLAGPPPTPLTLPVKDITASGAVGLGRDGTAALAVCSTVNFALRTATEQQALAGACGRWLNALSGPVQIVVRAHRLDLGGYLDALEDAAPALPHPQLEASAFAHARFLEQLAQQRDLLARQVLLVVHDRGPSTGAGGERCAQRLQDASRALAAADVTTRPLDLSQATSILAAVCDPDAAVLATTWRTP